MLASSWLRSLSASPFALLRSQEPGLAPGTRRLRQTATHSPADASAFCALPPCSAPPPRCWPWPPRLTVRDSQTRTPLRSDGRISDGAASTASTSRWTSRFARTLGNRQRVVVLRRFPLLASMAVGAPRADRCGGRRADRGGRRGSVVASETGTARQSSSRSSEGDERTSSGISQPFQSPWTSTASLRASRQH